MIALTKSNAIERCRTCLCKLIKNENNSQEEADVENPLQTKFVNIKSNKELQEMLRRYISLENETDLLNEQLYPQCICMECVEHLQRFETFRNKALENARKLFRLFNGEFFVNKMEINGEGQDCNEILDGSVKNEDVLSLFLKETLMETEAILLEGPDISNDFDKTDPDPFQSTKKQANKKTKARRSKQKSKDSLTTNKSITRKSKSNSLEDKEEHNSETKTEELAKKDKIEEDISYWQASTLHDLDNDSSDDEVLSNKIIHFKREVKERKAKRKKTDIDLKEGDKFSNYNFYSESLSKNSHTRQAAGKSGIISEIKNLKADKPPSDSIKSELDSDDLSSDSEFNAQSKTYSTVTKTEKKKRHCILNSGRKKGLANRYKCDQCQHKFGHKLTLEAHIRKVHEGQKKAFKCEMCDKAYSFIGGLSTHIRDVHERKQEFYDCTVSGCDKKYSNFMTLQRHVRFKHLNMENTHLYVCEQCGATFKQSSNLRYHMKTRHPTEEDLKRKELMPKDRLECEECKKSFHSQYTLKYHKLRVHADEKKFECKICGRRVAKQFMLDSHMLVHSDQKLACKFCGREFVRKYQVEAHIRAVHQKLKPFQCSHCSESFASRKTLRHHIYIHTGEKPYVCDICGQAYRQPTCLKNHRKIHNKLCTNDAQTSAVVSRNFLNNFVENNVDPMIN